VPFAYNVARPECSAEGVLLLEADLGDGQARQVR
jgi:hypothetical protein